MEPNREGPASAEATQKPRPITPRKPARLSSTSEAYPPSPPVLNGPSPAAAGGAQQNLFNDRNIRMQTGSPSPLRNEQTLPVDEVPSSSPHVERVLPGAAHQNENGLFSPVPVRVHEPPSDTPFQSTISGGASPSSANMSSGVQVSVEDALNEPNGGTDFQSRPLESNSRENDFARSHFAAATGGAYDHGTLHESHPSHAGSRRWGHVRTMMNVARSMPKDGTERPETLCAMCKKLDLTNEKFVIDSNAAHKKTGPDFWGRRKMGTLKEVTARAQPAENPQCKLCDLLLRAMNHELDVVEPNVGEDGDTIYCYLYWTVDGRNRERRDNKQRKRESQDDEKRKRDSKRDESRKRESKPEPQRDRESQDEQQRQRESRDEQPGQNEVKDEDQPNMKRTRRLCIEWSNRPKDKSYIVLVAPQGRFTADGRISEGIREQPTLFLGRLLTSINKNSFDLIDSWLKLCENNHQAECAVDTSLRQKYEKELRFLCPFFTVIDVMDMCLTALPEEDNVDDRYVALSYTWGDDPRFSGGHNPPKSSVDGDGIFKTTTENLAQLEQKGGLLAAMDKTFPVAIQNAIALTHRLGYRYLWVDSLCIIQNAPDHWEVNSEVMDAIYGNADFTICAADGKGATDKLKVLFDADESGPDRSAKQFVIDYELGQRPALKLMLSHPSESYISRSRWNNRAWTFQERLLSRRCLIFVGGRVYFQCRTTTMSEDIYSEAPKAGWSVELQGAPAHTLKPLSRDPVGVYKACLGMYTMRTLTFPDDVLAAFAGIANIIQTSMGKNCETHFGLPNSHFDWALLWEPEAPPKRRSTQKKYFPTWSWCGWQGAKITYNNATVAGPEINLHEWLTKHTWITYYIRDGRGRLRLVWDPLRHESSAQIEEHWRGYDSPGAGLPSTNLDSPPQYDFHGRPYNPDIPWTGRVPQRGQQFQRLLPGFRQKPTLWRPGWEEYDEMRRRETRADLPYLQFWTWSAEFYLGEETEDDPFSGSSVAKGLKRFAILDSEGDFAGTCVLDESWSAVARAGAPQQFIAMSEARYFLDSEYSVWSLYHEGERERSPWCLFNVMMLYYLDGQTDVAYRAGLGKVHQSAFDHGTGKREDRWKEIVLG